MGKARCSLGDVEPVRGQARPQPLGPRRGQGVRSQLRKAAVAPQHPPLTVSSSRGLCSSHFAECLFCFKTLFLEQCQAHSKIEKKFRGFPHAPCPHARTDSPAAHLPRRSGTLVTVDEPPRTGTSSPPRLRGSHWGSLVVVYALWAWANAACRASVTEVSHRAVSRP